MKVRFLTAYGLLLAATAFLYLRADVAVPTPRAFRDFPANQQEWRLKSEVTLDKETLEVLKPTDYLSRTYGDAQGNVVRLYVGYHGGGEGSGPIHSPKHCLPGSGWFPESERVERIAIGDTGLSLVCALYRKGESRELFLYWYRMRDKNLTSEYSLKWNELVGSAFNNRHDAAFIRLSISCAQSPEVAFEVGTRFLQDFYQPLTDMLPK